MPSRVNPVAPLVAHSHATHDTASAGRRPTIMLVPNGMFHVVTQARPASCLHPRTSDSVYVSPAVGSHQHVEGKENAEWRAGPLLGKDEAPDDELTRSVQRRIRLTDQIAIPLRRVAVDNRR
jgi:hypothetical protein